jgi:adenine phosphoribosyltransferase
MVPPLLEAVRARIRDVPDFPKPGIVFKDITPVLADAALFHGVVTALAARVATLDIQRVVAIEARGFIFGAALAYTLRRGFIPVRKPSKLPRATHREGYGLEYGRDVLELHIDAISKGERVLVVDDVLATGGTALATKALVERSGGTVAAFAFLVELGFLKGADKLGSTEVIALLRYD